MSAQEQSPAFVRILQRVEPCRVRTKSRWLLPKLLENIFDERGGFDPLPALTVDEYFDGNTDDSSLFAAVEDGEVALAEVRRVLTEIRDRDDVADVRVCPGTIGAEWLMATIVAVVTGSGSDEVRSWFPGASAPDDVLAPGDFYEETEPIEVPAGYQLWWCIWD